MSDSIPRSDFPQDSDKTHSSSDSLSQDTSLSHTLKLDCDEFWLLSLELRCILDEQGNFIALNPAWQRLLGWSKDELLNHSWISYVFAEDVEMTLACYQLETISSSLIDGEINIIELENRYRSRIGQYSQIRWSMRVTPTYHRYVVGQQIVFKAYEPNDQNINLFNVEQAIEIQLQQSKGEIEQQFKTKSDSLSNSILSEHGQSNEVWLKQLYAQTEQLATQYEGATSLADLPKFPIGYIGLFESLLESLYPAILYEISGVLMLQESVTPTPESLIGESIHLLINHRFPFSENLKRRLKSHLLETLSVLTGRKFQGVHLYVAEHDAKDDSKKYYCEKIQDKVGSDRDIADKLCSKLIVPLIIHSEQSLNIFGLLFVAAQPIEQFAEEQIQLLYNAASHLSISLQRLRFLWFKVERQYLSKVLNYLPTGIVLLDMNHQILFSNEFATAYMSYLDIKQEQGKLIQIGSESLDTLRQKNNLESGYRWELSASRSSEQVFEIVVRLLDPNEVDSDFIIIVHDITQRKQSERRVQQALEKERDAHLLQTEIIRMISHEYRSPLTSIIMATQTLERHSKELTIARCQSLLQLIEASAKHLAQLVDDMLIKESVESGKMKYNPQFFDLTKFCVKIITEIELLSQHQHKIRFLRQGDCEQVYLDPKILHQILINLLSNAVKYSPLGGQVTLSVHCISQKVCFRVQDEGIGIPSQDQVQLFQSFYRASNVGSIKGSGLGLNIVKKLTELHHGNITLGSRLGIGTTFLLELPQR